MNNPWPDTRDARQWLLLTAVLVLLGYNAPLLLPRYISLGHDGVLQYYPAEHALADALASGTLPFWTSHLQAGFPLFAQGQPGALYPINVLTFGLLPTPLAHRFTLIFHQALGLLGAIWWGRMLGISSMASVGMGLLFALSPPLNGDDVLLIDTVTWIPLLLGLAERCVQRHTPRAALLMIPLAAMQWLAGFPQIALYTALATHVYLGVRICSEDEPWAQRGALLAAWSCATALAMLLAAPQLLPTYELSHYSIRAAGAPEALAGEKSLFPAAILTLVLPSWRTFFFNAGLGIGMYIGILPAVLAATSIVTRPRRPWFYALLAMTATTLILALGQYNPLFPLLRRLPGFAYFRIPARYLYITQLGLITFAGCGWEVLVFGAVERTDRALRWCLHTVLAMLLLNGIAARPLLVWARPYLLSLAERYTVSHVMSNPFHVQSLAYYQFKIVTLYNAMLAAVSLGGQRVLLPLAVVVAGVWTWRWAGGRAAARRWLLPVWGCLVLVDLLAFAGWWRDTTTTTVVTEGMPVVGRLKAAMGASVCRFYWLTDAQMIEFGPQNLRVLQANYNLLFQLPSVGVYAPLAFGAYNDLMDRLGTVDLGIGFHPVRPEDVAHDRQLLDFLNVCFLVSREPLADFTPLTQVGDVRVYRNENAAPRAFAVGEVEALESTQGSVAWVKSHQARLREAAVLDEPLPVELSRDAAAHAEVVIRDYRDTAVSIDVTVTDAVLLVLTDTDYPGWQASIDGQATKLYRADALFRGVVVPRGAHRIDFQYRPKAFWQGLAIAAAAAAVALGWAVVARRRRARPISRARAS